MTLQKRDSDFFGWERKGRRIPGGRLSISLRTKDRKEAKRRAAALDLLVERGEMQILDRLRSGELHIAEVANAVRDLSVDDLRARSEVDLSLGAMVDRVLATKEATRTEGTRKHYAKIAKAMLARWGRERPIVDISTDELRAWLYEPKGARKRPWAPNTQVGASMVANYLWSLAIELETEAVDRIGVRPRIARNPWANIETSARPSPRHAFLEPKEWKVVLQHATGRPEAALLGVCCLAGLRVGEALVLRTGVDVDLEAGMIRVQPRDGEYAWKPKHVEHSTRDVPIPPALRSILDDHIAAGFAGARFFIHAPRWDQPLSYTKARAWVRVAFERAGLKYGREGSDDLTAHSLRHTFASWLVREGWSSSLVAALMGNTSREVDKTYAHLQPDDLTKVVATIDRLVSQ